MTAPYHTSDPLAGVARERVQILRVGGRSMVVDGYRFGWWAVTACPDNDGVWVLTHLPTGLKAPYGWHSPARAARTLLRILPLRDDWNFCPQTVAECVAEVADFVEAFRSICRDDPSAFVHMALIRTSDEDFAGRLNAGASR